MIFVRDKGRLCNNILQYGHLYAWGREHGRQTMSMRFAYKYRYFRICHTRYHNPLVYVFAKYAAKWGLLPVASFDVDGDDQPERMLTEHRHIVAQGWCAHWYDLFLKYKDEILQLFTIDEKYLKSADSLLARVPRGTVKVGLHVRRGDYRTWNGGRYYFSDEQFIGVLRQFIGLHEGETLQVFVCGNDPQLDESLYRRSLPGCVLEFPHGSAVGDLYLLSQCDWLIGPPSTFTLVASMYRNVPLYWIENPEATLTADSFGFFDTLFREIR